MNHHAAYEHDAIRHSDREMRAHENHHESLRLWLRLLSCSLLIEGEIRQRLRAHFDVTLSRFDLLAQLERHREGLTMGELTRRMMVSGGNVTALVDQLEQEKLVQRHADPQDRRSFRVRLTAAGRRGFHRMAGQHEQWVIDLFSGLGDRQRAQLHRLLGDLKSAVHQHQAHAQEESQ